MRYWWQRLHCVFGRHIKRVVRSERNDIVWSHSECVCCGHVGPMFFTPKIKGIVHE